MKERECPKCGAEMEHQEWDPDVGIMSSYYFCQACDYSEDSEAENDPDIDRP